MKKISKIFIGFIISLALVGCGSNEKSDSSHIKIGVTGEYNEVLEEVIKRYEEGTGNTAEIVSFADYSQPNEALLSGDIDLNAFQNYNWLNDYKRENGDDIVALGNTMLAPLILYSNKHDSVEGLEDGAKIAIPNDPPNESRALRLLKAAGLIDIGGEPGDIVSVSEISKNPKNLEIIPMDASQTARSLGDVDASAVNDNFALDAGLDIDKAIFVEDKDSEDIKVYINVIAARKEDKDNETYKEFVDYYQTDETKKDYERITKGAWIPAW